MEIKIPPPYALTGWFAVWPEAAAQLSVVSDSAKPFTSLFTF